MGFPNKLAAVKSLFSFGVKTGYLSANPAAMIKTIKAKEALNERILLEQEVKELIDAADNERDRCSDFIVSESAIVRVDKLHILLVSQLM